jgi:phosphoglucosamine mutase
VKEVMRKHNFNLGGEQSGHIILGNFATTGDGLLVALETLFALRKGQSANKIFKVYKSVPQKLLNVKVKDKKVINSSKFKRAVKLANSLIKNKGRLLVRASGTEPKIRIMCESFNNSLINKCINIVKKTIN